MTIRVVNTKDYCVNGLPNTVSFYVGRPRRDAHNRANHVLSVLGNPYPINDETERDRACEEYDKWLRKAYHTDYDVRLAIHTIEYNHRLGYNVDLVCFCHPKRCHVQSIKRLVEELSERWAYGPRETLNLSTTH